VSLGVKLAIFTIGMVAVFATIYYVASFFPTPPY
jgi:hypothetical protein